MHMSNNNIPSNPPNPHPFKPSIGKQYFYVKIISSLELHYEVPHLPLLLLEKIGEKKIFSRPIEWLI